MNPSTSFQRLRLFVLLLVSCLLLLTPGCLDLEEELFLNRDGSGTYVNTIDLARLGEMISMMAPDTIREQIYQHPERFLDSFLHAQGIAAALSSLSSAYTELEGIDQVSISLQNGSIRIRYDFDDIDALNQALSLTVIPGIDLPASSFEFQKGALIRQTYKRDVQTEDHQQDQIEMSQMMMGDATYRLRYHFPGRIKSRRIKGGFTSEGGRTIEYEYTVLDLIQDASILENTLQFRRR